MTESRSNILNRRDDVKAIFEKLKKCRNDPRERRIPPDLLGRVGS
jgi:hypothetical protein